MGKGLVRGWNQSRILTFFVWRGVWLLLLLLCDDCGWLGKFWVVGWMDGVVGWNDDVLGTPNFILTAWEVCLLA